MTSWQTPFLYDTIPCGSPVSDGCGELVPKAAITGHEMWRTTKEERTCFHELNCSYLPVPCIHEGCIERPRKIDLSSHLEACKACDTRNEEGHCVHVDQLDVFLADLLGEHPHTSFSEYFSDISNGLDTGGELGELDTYHKTPQDKFLVKEEYAKEEQKKMSPYMEPEAQESVASTLASMNEQIMKFSDSSPSDYSQAFINGSWFEDSNTTKEDTTDSHDRGIVLDEQPPIFSPPPNATKEQVQQLRRMHLRALKNLSAEEKLRRRKWRNKQNALKSRRKRYERLEELRERRLQIQNRLNDVALRASQMRTRALELQERHENCIKLLHSIRYVAGYS
eukprot:jgi/Galph1/5171/GphlegSOOS_G3828.1